jgi:hypothetical protein
MIGGLYCHLGAASRIIRDRYLRANALFSSVAPTFSKDTNFGQYPGAIAAPS